jgi:hypothetical protein
MIPLALLPLGPQVVPIRSPADDAFGPAGPYER